VTASGRIIQFAREVVGSRPGEAAVNVNPNRALIGATEEEPRMTRFCTRKLLVAIGAIALVSVSAPQTRAANVRPLVSLTGGLRQLQGGDTLSLPASGTGGQINFAPSTAPSAPADGDCWIQNSGTPGFYCQILGATVGPLGVGGGSVSSVSSANGDLTVASPTSTPVLTVVSAPKWDVARTLSFTGDATGSGSVDGSGDVATALSVTKTGGVAFAASATTDTTNAANIVSGSLAYARLVALASGDVVGNCTSGSAAPQDCTLSALIDKAFGSTRGTILYRGASAWTALVPGTSGDFLETQGSGADPVWAPASNGSGGGGGGLTLLATATVSGSTTTSVSFTGISGSYTHLKIVWQALITDTGSREDVLVINVNGDTTSGHYRTTAFTYYGNLDGAGFQYGTYGFLTSYGVLGCSPAGTESGNADFSTGEFNITNYLMAGSSPNVTIECKSWMANTVNYRQWEAMNNWLPGSATAITSVNIYSGSNSGSTLTLKPIAPGSKFWLYAY
jgi:hypothetical protein